MLNETIKMLNLKPNGIYVDCTLGGGGHAFEIIKRIYPHGILIGLDRDLAAINAARERLKDFKKNIHFVNENFRNLKLVIKDLGYEKIDGILYDLGVSSYQLDQPKRGFTYNIDAPLDMRMDIKNKVTAEELVNKLSKQELTKIIKDYGEERWASRIAEFIVRERQSRKIKTTGQLVSIIKKAIPAGARRQGPHPAKRTFQALRIAVNDELKAVEESLKDAVDLLKTKARICVISFHSLEDRIVKSVFLDMASDCNCPPELPVCICNKSKKLEIITKKPIVPQTDEIEKNPRSRSAKLRVAEKI
ncbi:MAG: rRNA (cytosine1402-N4)-methyltransferase [Thermosediminibacterales bacterium]|nr:rRNA (cytosine1402-N4)-methyltransferase [Thermosediminibacterales bacterium]